jgi:preprotein translocase subunit SecE
MIEAMELLTLEGQSYKKKQKKRRESEKENMKASWPSRNTWFATLFIIIVSACIFIL